MHGCSTLAAVLIVRDESRHIEACLQSVRAVVDQMLVYDTGSTDDTIALAESAGARVIRGRWHGGFAATRNAALAEVTSDWVLSIDADERLVSDGRRLREVLRRLSRLGRDAVLLEVENRTSGGGAYHHVCHRILRPSTVCWSGSVHEQLVRLDGVTELRQTELDPLVARLVHLGYEDDEVRRRKSERNLTLAYVKAGDLVDARASTEDVAAAHLDIGRSLIGADRPAEARDALVGVRSSFPKTGAARDAGEILARLLLAEARDDEALALAEELEGEGTNPGYCRWIAAQAAAQLGDFPTAWSLLAPVQEVRDSHGRRFGQAELLELRSIIGALAGHVDR